MVRAFQEMELTADSKVSIHTECFGGLSRAHVDDGNVKVTLLLPAAGSGILGKFKCAAHISGHEGPVDMATDAERAAGLKVTGHWLLNSRMAIVVSYVDGNAVLDNALMVPTLAENLGVSARVRDRGKPEWSRRTQARTGSSHWHPRTVTSSPRRHRNPCRRGSSPTRSA